MNGGWGVGWTVELKLNRKKKKKMDSNGEVATPLTPLDLLLSFNLSVKRKLQKSVFLE